jgi:DNA-binding transcriptional MerR regulator
MKKQDKAKLAEGLGASRVVEVGQKKIGGPLDMLALCEEFNERLQSSGGRPTDPSWKLSLQVPFKEESWSRLQDIASEVGVSGRRVGPAQVAALLVENSLEELEDARWEQALGGSRAIPLLSEPEAADAAGVTYNQFHDWVQRGWLVPAGRRGRQRSFGADEIVRANWLRSIGATPVELDEVIEDVRACDLSARYLVATNAENVRTAASRTQLYRILEAPGSHLVIDQLPERRKLLGLPPFPDDGHDERRVQQAV